MNDNVISLRNYINNKNQIDTIKVQTFCRLMKKVYEAIEQEQRKLIRINLDEIQIKTLTGEIVFSDDLFSAENDLEKTIVGFNTGISMMADRKSTEEQKNVAFALMLLGWYCNEDGSAVNNDMIVLEHFDEYMKKVPLWLNDFFVKIFRNMNYDLSFSKYYDDNFTNKVKKEIENAFASYNLSSEQLNKIAFIVANETKRVIKEGVGSER